MITFFFVQAPTSHSKQRSARWGKAAGEVLLQEWNTALEDLQQLKTDIDSSANPTEMVWVLYNFNWTTVCYSCVQMTNEEKVVFFRIEIQYLSLNSWLSAHGSYTGPFMFSSTIHKAKTRLLSGVWEALSK